MQRRKFILPIDGSSSIQENKYFPRSLCLGPASGRRSLHVFLKQKIPIRINILFTYPTIYIHFRK